MTRQDREKQATTMTLAPALHFSIMIADKMQEPARKKKNSLQLSGLFMCRRRRCRKWFDLQISLMPSLRIPHHHNPPPTLQVVSWGKQMTDVERQTRKRVTWEVANEFQHIASVLGDGEKHFHSFRHL